jgi:hypothetical protein
MFNPGSTGRPTYGKVHAQTDVGCRRLWGFVDRTRRSSVMTLPASPAIAISWISVAHAQKFVPVEPPTPRPNLADNARIAPILAASSTATIRSMTPGRKLASTRGQPIPSTCEQHPSGRVVTRGSAWWR